MPKAKAKKPQFYAVRRGRVPGVYETWDEALAQVHGYSGAAHQGFKTREEAEAFLSGPSMSSTVPSVAPVTSASKPYTRPVPAQEKKTPAKYIAPVLPARKEESKGLVEVEDGKSWRVVYTDGACSGNGQLGARGGVGVYWGPGMTNVAERLGGAQTNNRAELIALVRALETDPDPSTPLMIKTDSSYSIQCMRDWLPKWRKNGFRTGNGPVKNKELLLYLSSLMDDRPGHLKLQHVRGHMGIAGNEMADQLAVAGAALPDVEDRDWTVKVLEVVTPRPDHVDFEVPPELLLSEKELLDMEKTQRFD
ncbi:hypothetical protein CALVIDRAFT_562669 [Calocera viscosa TUFC12733]|uniref:Ribonuclease H n=1 Tax=Calocera viscosa (strain TUFC12733) TaxID=1330018 RepID=A0A167NJ47_CALVF|nr:hypothetical protein CALVIDRAFT_562669 [Calocera viscosa TUFC12733]